MRKIGLEFLGVFGLSPVKLVEIASDLGCDFIGTVPAPMDYNPEGFDRWNLMEDAHLRCELKAVLAERGVELLLGDGCPFLPGASVRDALGPNLDLYHELGITRVNSISFLPSIDESCEQFAQFAELAVERGMIPTIEFCPISVVGNLAAAVRVVRHAGPHARLLIDAMHFYRSGSTVAELAEVADLAGHVQLCDAPREPSLPEYMDEALYARRVPGEGDAPLVEMLAAVPQAQTIGLEIPMRDLAEQGIGPHERMARCVAGARRVIALADA
ncbi:MAG TPA: TIM barrel protein [Novosphingobium sp.]